MVWVRVRHAADGDGGREVIDPSPSAIEFAASIQDEKVAWPAWDERVDKVMTRFLDGEFESTLAPSTWRSWRCSNPRPMKRRSRSPLRHLFGRYRRQARSFERIGAIAPTLAARSLSMAFAGTDEAHDREFAAAASRYRTAMLTTLNGEPRHPAGSTPLTTLAAVISGRRCCCSITTCQRRGGRCRTRCGVPPHWPPADRDVRRRGLVGLVDEARIAR